MDLEGGGGREEGTKGRKEEKREGGREGGEKKGGRERGRDEEREGGREGSKTIEFKFKINNRQRKEKPRILHRTFEPTTTLLLVCSYQHHGFPPSDSDQLHNAGMIQSDHDPSLTHELLWQKS